MNLENLHSAAALVEKGDFKACKDLSEGFSQSRAGELVHKARIPMSKSENIPPSPSESHQEVRPQPECSLTFCSWEPQARSKAKRSSYSPAATRHLVCQMPMCNSSFTRHCDLQRHQRSAHELQRISCALSLDVVILPPKNPTWLSMRRPIPVGGIGEI